VPSFFDAPGCRAARGAGNLDQETSMPIRRFFQHLVLCAIVTATVHPATAAELLTNGGFETGDFTGWIVSRKDGSSGNWFVIDANQGPLSAYPTAGPATGSWYAMSDQTSPGAQAITQYFSVPIDARSVVVSFNLFVNDWSGAGPIFGPGLDFTGAPNQHARVDLMAAVPDPFDVGAGVMATGYLGVDAGELPRGWQPYSFDITPYVLQGGAYAVRFAQVDNQSFFHMGVDDVSITATVPEPATWASMAVGGLALVAVCRRQRRAGRRQPTLAA
jgi:hypothetical protein